MSDRVTRKSKRIVALSTTTTSLSVSSPAATSARESMVPDTPLTSMDSDVQIGEENEKTAATRSVSLRISARKKRPSAFRGEEDEDALRPLKKRAVSNRAYVEVPRRKSQAWNIPHISETLANMHF